MSGNRRFPPNFLDLKLLSVIGMVNAVCRNSTTRTAIQIADKVDDDWHQKCCLPYAPAQIVRDAGEHGTEVRPVCVNSSRWGCTLEPTEDEERFAVRLGMRPVKGLANAHAAEIVAVRADRPFASVDDLWRRAGVPAAALIHIAEADAFGPSLDLARREALWAADRSFANVACGCYS